MYHPKIIEAKLKLAEQSLGFTPVRHSVADCRNAVDHLDSLVTEDGKLIRSLKKNEIQWIRNERALCTCDFRYSMTRYAHIKDMANRIRLTEPNVAQNIVLDIWGELEEKEFAIMLLALKARQLGVSTLTELAVAHRVMFTPGCNAVVGSNDPDKSWEMFQMVELCWQKMPWWLMPEATKNESGKLVEFGKQDSRVSIQHGTQRSGIARGTTPTVAHLSELADYDDPEDLVDGSLLRAMHDSPAILCILESTANGRHNWWHNKWEFAIKHWKDHTSRLCPMFLPWYVGTDLYPTPTWLRAHPVPERWQPSNVTENHADRANSFVRMNDLLRRYLGDKWTMPREQMWFWEVTREEYREQKNLANFYQEMPADDNEAFQSTNISVFDAEICSQYHEAIKDEDVEVYGIVGSQADIPLRLQPDRRDIDYTAIEQGRRKVIPIRYTSESGQTKDFEFWPLKFSGYTGFDPDGKLFIWEHPKNGYEYGLGVDTGEGIGLDQSVIEGLRKGTFTENDKQVFEFSSPYINAHDLWPVCLAIGAYYSTRDREGDRRQPKMVIECMKNGEVVQHELRKMGWSNFHQWVRYDNRKIRKGNAQKMGWVQTSWARSMMIDTIVKYLRDGWCDINSPWFVDEMRDLERDDSLASIKAMHGGHDDRIMSLGICLFSLHDMEIRGGAQSAAQTRATREEETANYPVYRPGMQERDGDEDQYWEDN